MVMEYFNQVMGVKKYCVEGFDLYTQYEWYYREIPEAVQKIPYETILIYQH